MCSFGEGISMTPLQLGALVSAIANGGTLYYLQHPTTPEEAVNFQPRIKRQLEIADVIPELSDGMTGAVQYGTARRLRTNFSEEQILGKTGTCSKDGTRFGWFTSYANTQYGHIVTVIFLRGGRPTYGPKAAEITGKFYRNLYDHNFFAAAAGRHLVQWHAEKRERAAVRLFLTIFSGLRWKHLALFFIPGFGSDARVEQPPSAVLTSF